jgi:hypothetical protein
MLRIYPSLYDFEKDGENSEIPIHEMIGTGGCDSIIIGSDMLEVTKIMLMFGVHNCTKILEHANVYISIVAVNVLH